GRTIRYVASDEISPNEIAQAIGKEIGKPNLEWKVVSNDELLNSWLSIGFNEQIAKGFVAVQASQGTGELYEDYYQHQPILGKVKLADFVKEFAVVYQKDE